MSPLIKYHCNSYGKMYALLPVVAAVLISNSATLAQSAFSGEPRPVSAKLNQSVALDADDIGSHSQQSNANDSVKREAQVDASSSNVGSAFAGSSESASGEAPHEYLPPRGARTKIRFSDKTLPVAEKSTPWYSSGIGAMAVVFVAIGIVYVLVRKYMPGSIVVPCQGVKVIGRVALSPKHRAVLVKLGDRAILIGLGGDQMTTLAEITDQDEVARLSQEANLGTAAKSPEFNAWLRREQEDYTMLEDTESIGKANKARASRRSPMGDLLDKLRSFQKTSSRK